MTRKPAGTGRQRRGQPDTYGEVWLVSVLYGVVVSGLLSVETRSLIVAVVLLVVVTAGTGWPQSHMLKRRKAAGVSSDSELAAYYSARGGTHGWLSAPEAESDQAVSGDL
jgi:hypothetical protein